MSDEDAASASCPYCGGKIEHDEEYGPVYFCEPDCKEPSFHGRTNRKPKETHHE